ncbi:MAG: hypothetical protein DMG07_04715 [Acidobacteria bacterium]|nr:MAG: hypothetical protein DMG07_04715 [Acidobacteriota bacterium]
MQARARVLTSGVAALILLALGFGQPAGALRVGDRKQLFIDRRFIESTDNVTLRVNPPVKAGIVLDNEHPWEAGWVGGGSVVDDGGTYRMWYRTMEEGRDGKLGATRTGYATSTDGLHWTKPSLGLVEFQGSRANNLIDAPSGSVFLDPKAPPEQRFKMVVHAHQDDLTRAGLYIRYSADGLHWTLHDVRLFPFACDTDNQAFYDERIGKYVAYFRVWDPWRKVGRIETGDILRPWPMKPIERPNYLWGKRRPPTPSTEVETVFSYDDADPAVTDIYTPGVHRYPWADDAYFMFPSIYRHFPEPAGGDSPAGYGTHAVTSPDSQGHYRNDGVLDIQLAAGRDGVHWDRYDRRSYIELGVDGMADSRSMYILIGWIRRGGEIYQYYAGYDHFHGEYAGFKRLRGMGAIVRTVQRLDGFVSADADYRGGSLTTPLVEFAGSRLELNAQTAATGDVRVELADARGVALPGFAAADCDPLLGNHLARTVTWRGRADLGALAGKPVRLVFRLRNAKLYAFQFRSQIPS